MESFHGNVNKSKLTCKHVLDFRNMYDSNESRTIYRISSFTNLTK